MVTELPGNIMMGIPDRLGIDGALAAGGDFVYRMGLGRTAQPFLLVPGVVEMLQKLKPHFPMSIVSARGWRSMQFFLDQYALRPYFWGVATAQTCRAGAACSSCRDDIHKTGYLHLSGFRKNRLSFSYSRSGRRMW